jgi:membrane protease YdiL (CAAX protease family)
MNSKAYGGTSRRRGVLALALLLPAPTIGVAFGMIWFPDTSVGTAVFAASKLWVFALPAVWLMVVDKEPPSWSHPKEGGFGVAALLGVIMSAVIVLVYAVLPDETLNAERLQTAVLAVGLDSPGRYLAGAAYWIAVNSVLEEYVWRWFVVRQIRAVSTPSVAVAGSAAAFTVHHIVAMQVYLSWPLVALASAGIFLGAATWSWCYVRFQSVWPGYLSHAIVDVAVFAIGYRVLFS